jgi:ethanolamine-phosphate cytidylyltransferase
VGRFVTIKRTEGISTTDLVGRMLMCVRGSETKDQLARNAQANQLKEFSTNPMGATEWSEDAGDSPKSAATRVSQFLPTSRRFVQFSSGIQPFPGATIVYVDGAFDMFHSGAHTRT